MRATWIPVGSAVAIILLGLGVLEVMSERVRVDEPSATWRSWVAPTPSGLTPDDLLPLDLGREPALRSADGDDR
jgi:hypothetical protein